MDEEVYRILLNGVPLPQFIAFVVAGTVGIIFSYGINIGMAVRNDPNTPKKFQRKSFQFKFWRVLIAFMTVVITVIFNQEILGLVLNSEAPIELNLWSAFLAGMGWDRAGKSITTIKR